jgi:hypothetical protein
MNRLPLVVIDIANTRIKELAMSKQLNLHIIEHARTLITSEAHWCRRQIALDADGVPVCATDEKASKLCAYGALMAAAHQIFARGELFRRQQRAH